MQSTLVEHTSWNDFILERITSDTNSGKLWPELFKLLRAYTDQNKSQPFYILDDVQKSLDYQFPKNFCNDFTPDEIMIASVNGKKMHVLTRHGLYRLLSSMKGPIGNYHRKFVYTMLDLLNQFGNASLVEVNKQMESKHNETLIGYLNTIETLQKRNNQLNESLETELESKSLMALQYAELKQETDELKQHFEFSQDGPLLTILQKSLKQLFVYQHEDGVQLSTKEYKRLVPIATIPIIDSKEFDAIKQNFRQDGRVFKCSLEDIEDFLHHSRVERAASC